MKTGQQPIIKDINLYAYKHVTTNFVLNGWNAIREAPHARQRKIGWWDSLFPIKYSETRGIKDKRSWTHWRFQQTLHRRGIPEILSRWFLNTYQATLKILWTAWQSGCATSVALTVNGNRANTVLSLANVRKVYRLTCTADIAPQEAQEMPSQT